MFAEKIKSIIKIAADASVVFATLQQIVFSMSNASLIG